jgi:hypothetical protein
MANRAKNRLFQGGIGNNNTRGKFKARIIFVFCVWGGIPYWELKGQKKD